MLAFVSVNVLISKPHHFESCLDLRKTTYRLLYFDLTEARSLEEEEKYIGGHFHVNAKTMNVQVSIWRVMLNGSYYLGFLINRKQGGFK